MIAAPKGNETTPITAEDLAEFERRLAEHAIEQVEKPARYVDGQPVIWSPHEGSQKDFLDCPFPEVLYHGNRGPGKTDGLLMSFAQHVGRGWGPAWRGILFRQTYPQLADVVAKSEKWFRQLWPDAKFTRGGGANGMCWTWPTGEVLLFRHIDRVEHYWNYHGHEYPFIGFEELCNWPTDECYTKMLSCNRSSHPGVVRWVRSTTNPWGPGHTWVKFRFDLHGDFRKTKVMAINQDAALEKGHMPRVRCAIHGHLRENTTLLAAQPTYEQDIIDAATNPSMAKAWVDGSWEIVAGGMFSDVFRSEHNVLPAFAIPRSWRIDRSHDWGSSSPSATLWFAESDGSDYLDRFGESHSTRRGDLFVIGELYTWDGTLSRGNGTQLLPREVAKEIVRREKALEIYGRVQPGPADTQIWDVNHGTSIASEMIHEGVRWARADKGSGSRKTGWQLTRTMMKGAWPPDEPGAVRETSGLFVFETCEQFLRTVPVLARSERDLEDIDENAGHEDHIADALRYRIRGAKRRSRSSTSVGVTH